MILSTLWCNYWPFAHLLLLICLFISLVHFLNFGVVCLFIIDLQELFTYSWYKSLVRYMHCDYFSQSDLSIYFSWIVFLEEGILNFYKVQLTFFMIYDFCVPSNTFLPTLRSWVYHSRFPSIYLLIYLRKWRDLLGPYRTACRILVSPSGIEFRPQSEGTES